MFEYDYAVQRAKELQREAAAERLAQQALAGRPAAQPDRRLALGLGLAVVMVGLGVSMRVAGLAAF